MRVLKIEAEGLTASFRYPFFMWGRQPTFDMPPPATLYGLICGTVGEWVDPHDLRFGYSFTCENKDGDLEHFQATTRGSGKFTWRGEQVPKNLDVQVQPLIREFLLHPRLVLYINRPEWYDAFMNPYYPVTLGRSQDLCTYTDVRVVELVERPRAYVEHTIVPGALGSLVKAGVAITMPRYVDYERDRTPAFGQYVMVSQRQWLENGGSFLVDPETEEDRGAQRAVILHGFVD